MSWLHPYQFSGGYYQCVSVFLEMFVSHSVYLDSEAQEPDECVRQAPQVSGVRNCADRHVHTPAPCCDCHQDPSHYTEEGEDIAPRHREAISFAYFSTEGFFGFSFYW